MKAHCIVFPEPLVATTGEIEIGPPAAGQLLTKTLITGVSTGTETRVFRGGQDGARFPLIPGYENLGEVLEAGPDTSIKPGARVFTKAMAARGSGTVVNMSSMSAITPLNLIFRKSYLRAQAQNGIRGRDFAKAQRQPQLAGR